MGWDGSLWEATRADTVDVENNEGQFEDMDHGSMGARGGKGEQ